MARADYDTWTAAVHIELKSRNLDVPAAYDAYSFNSAYHEFDYTPREAVEDYQKWLENECLNEGDENDETLEYMCELLEAGEVDPDEFKRQLRSVGYTDDTISRAIASVL